MPKRKSEDIEGQKHRGPTLLTYFPKVSRPDSNSEGSERPSQSVGDSDSSETVDKSASEHLKEPSAKTTDENRHSKIGGLMIIRGCNMTKRRT